MMPINKSQNLSNMHLVLDNIRSCYNVGSIIRSMGFFGFNSLIVIGNTPYPRIEQDNRPKYIIDNNTKQIAKTALGAEMNINIHHYDFDREFYHSLNVNDILISVEQDTKATPLEESNIINENLKTYLVFGSEDKGVSTYLLEKSHTIIEIMGLGQKESLNVGSSVAIVLSYISMPKARWAK